MGEAIAPPATLYQWVMLGGATFAWAIVAWAFYSGRIVARSIHDARIAELTNDRDHWRDAYQTLAGPVERILIASAGRHAGADAASAADRTR